MKWVGDSGDWKPALQVDSDCSVEVTRDYLVVRGLGCGPDDRYPATINVPWHIIRQAFEARAKFPVSYMQEFCEREGVAKVNGAYREIVFGEPIEPK